MRHIKAIFLVALGLGFCAGNAHAQPSFQLLTDWMTHGIVYDGQRASVEGNADIADGEGASGGRLLLAASHRRDKARFAELRMDATSAGDGRHAARAFLPLSNNQDAGLAIGVDATVEHGLRGAGVVAPMDIADAPHWSYTAETTFRPSFDFGAGDPHLAMPIRHRVREVRYLGAVAAQLPRQVHHRLFTTFGMGRYGWDMLDSDTEMGLIGVEWERSAFIKPGGGRHHVHRTDIVLSPMRMEGLALRNGVGIAGGMRTGISYVSSELESKTRQGANIHLSLEIFGQHRAFGLGFGMLPTTDPTGKFLAQEFRTELYARGRLVRRARWSARAVGSWLSEMSRPDDDDDDNVHRPVGFRGAVRGELTIGRSDRLQMGVHGSLTRELNLGALTAEGLAAHSDNGAATGVFVRFGRSKIGTRPAGSRSRVADLSNYTGH